MNLVSAQQDNINMMLTQMGAKVKSIHGLLGFVRFDINNTEIIYVYNVNAKEQYYLQKVRPYPVGAGVFSKPDEIVEYIKKDIKLFKNASKSKTFEKFINISANLHSTVHKVEDIFLNYNVSAEKFAEINVELEHIDKILTEIKDSSDEIIIK